MTFLNSTPLNIIMEEEEQSSRSCSPLPSSLKAKRRHARITRDDIDNAFLSPRPAPSPTSSSESLRLSQMQFPCPPMSDFSSSPSSAAATPLTPSSSDSDTGFCLPSPRFNPRRAGILPRKFSSQREPVHSDSESDSDWYHKELSNLISTPSPSHSQPSRPDSFFIHADFHIPIAKRPSRTSDTFYPRKRRSASISIPKYPPPPVPPIPEHLRNLPLPPTPPSSSASSCSHPRDSSIGFSRPPPRSSLPNDCVFDLYLDGGAEADEDSDASSEFSFTMYEVDFGERERNAVTSNPLELPQSPCENTSFSSHSEPGQEVEIHLDEFEMDYRLKLPLSIPSSPLDLDADITTRFELLRKEEMESTTTVAAEEPLEPQLVTSAPEPKPVPSREVLYTPSTISSFSFSPSPSAISFYDQTTHHNDEERVLKSRWSTSTLGSMHEDSSRKSKSQKKSGERARSTSAKLKFYFSGSSSKTTPKKRPSSSVQVPSKPDVFYHSPLSPGFPVSPHKHNHYSPSLSPSPLRWPNARTTYESNPKRTSKQAPYSHTKSVSVSAPLTSSPPCATTRSSHQPISPSRSPEVIVIGYHRQSGGASGLKRRGSNATVSSEGGRSDFSASSSSSSGLRRKPIPIEMFLRNAL